MSFPIIKVLEHQTNINETINNVKNLNMINYMAVEKSTVF